MTTHDDILTCIADGRLAVERTVAFSMACTLAKVEAMVREMRPTAETTERGNTAEIQELEEMRQALDDADYAPTVAGLRDALGEAERAVRVWKEQDEALRAERDALRAEVAALTRDRDSFTNKIDILYGEIKHRDGMIDALTPGPWLDPATDPPPFDDLILTLSAVGSVALCSLSALGGVPSWLHRWRRIPSALLTPPEVTPAPNPKVTT